MFIFFIVFIFVLVLGNNSSCHTLGKKYCFYLVQIFKSPNSVATVRGFFYAPFLGRNSLFDVLNRWLGYLNPNKQKQSLNELDIQKSEQWQHSVQLGWVLEDSQSPCYVAANFSGSLQTCSSYPKEVKGISNLASQASSNRGDI